MRSAAALKKGLQFFLIKTHKKIIANKPVTNTNVTKPALLFFKKKISTTQKSIDTINRNMLIPVCFLFLYARCKLPTSNSGRTIPALNLRSYQNLI